ncbi:MAG: NERD domain-containing protein [Myxococcota bacterium]
MTRMLPTTIHSSVTSRAEHHLYETIRDAPGSEHWVCLHSLGLARHETKRRGEIDFVLLTNHGVFVLEAKSGNVSRKNGVWYSNHHELHESPFDQASSGMFELARSVRERFHGKPLAKTLFGYGVVMPDVTYDIGGPESDPRSVYDRRDIHKPFAAYVDRLAQFARESDPRPRNALNKARIDELADFLRGDFDLVPTMDAIITDTRAELAELTKEQRGVLDALHHSPRLIVDGGAGSGKTLLAIEAARRMAREGKRVLFLTFNKLLAARIGSGAATEDYAGELLVRNAHRHFHEVIKASPLADEFAAKFDPSNNATFDELLPEYAEVAASDSDEWLFDAIVMDEAQDLLTTRNLNALSEMLDGGLDQGCWFAFLDSQDQAVVYGKGEEAALSRLRQHSITQTLTTNCRNTQPIARATALLSGSKRRSKARVSGPPVEFIPYREQNGWAGNLERVVNEIRREGINPGQVSVLLARKPDEKEAKVLDRLSIHALSEDTVPALGTSVLDHITWSTASGFKGLENDAVIVVGVRGVEKAWSRGVVYVGMSRARTRLYVILSEACEQERQQRLEAQRDKRPSDVEMLL